MAGTWTPPPAKHRELGLTDREFELICARARSRAQRRRAGDVLAALVRALRLQALAEAAAPAADRGRRAWSWARARTPARSTSATASRSPSRSSPTTIRAPSSRSRAPPPASAGSCATSSRSARGRSRCSTRCASASSTRERSRYLFDHVVAGIGHYGNSIGVPTVGGEVYFEAPYEQNCLVNAMCVGLARTDRMVRAAAAGVGNVIVLMGASTGRDGIGGASVLASAELEEGDDKRPDGADRRPLRGEEGHGVLPRAARPPTCSSRSRTSAPRA